jgi:glucokinase
LARPTLTPAERRVADLVLAQARSVASDPIMDIAQRAGVSQPTVVRFCRSMSCAGLSDFKLKLAAGLTGTIPVSHTQVRRSDTALELGAKVLDNTAAAMLMMRNQLNGTIIQRCVEHLRGARRVDCYASPHFGSIAAEAQYTLMRFGVPAMAYVEAQLQALAAVTLCAGDVVVAISGAAPAHALLETIDMALERGATVIALMPGHSPLAKRATLAIAIDHMEDITTQIPMISRILHLAMIDILAVGVAMSSGRDSSTMTDRGDTAATREASPDLAYLTSHSR